MISALIPSYLNTDSNIMQPVINEQNLVYYASDICVQNELEHSIFRIKKLFGLSNQSLDYNFKRVFKSSENGLYTDWKLSSLAYKVLLLSKKVPEPILFGYLTAEISESFLWSKFFS